MFPVCVEDDSGAGRKQGHAARNGCADITEQAVERHRDLHDAASTSHDRMTSAPYATAYARACASNPMLPTFSASLPITEYDGSLVTAAKSSAPGGWPHT